MDERDIYKKLFDDSYEKLQKIEELSDLPYGTLEIEIQALMYFMFKTIINNSSKYSKMPVKTVQKGFFNIMIDVKLDDLNQLFDMSKFRFRNILNERIRYYEKIFKDAENKQNPVKIKDIKDKIIYASSYIFYILSADKISFNENSSPFASIADVRKHAIKLRNENYKKYNNLDKFYDDYYILLDTLYLGSESTADDILDRYEQEMIKRQYGNDIHLTEGASDSNSITKQHDFQSDDPSMHIVIAILVIFVITVFCFIKHSENELAKVNAIVEQKMGPAYECYKNKDMECVNKIASEISQLNKKPTSYVFDDLESRFNNERVSVLYQLVEANKSAYIPGIDENEFTYKFIQIKNNNLKTYFNNSEEELYEALDNYNGYKYYSKKPQPMPKTGIIETSISQNSKSNNVHLLTHSDDLFVKFTDVNSDKFISVFIRKNEIVNMYLPKGEYKIDYYGGKTWCGKEDLFKHETMKGESSKNLIVGDRDIYIGQKVSAYADIYVFDLESKLSMLTEYDWAIALRIIAREGNLSVELPDIPDRNYDDKKPNPNYDLEFIDKQN